MPKQTALATHARMSGQAGGIPHHLPSLPAAHLKGSMEVVIQRQDEVHNPCGLQERWAAGVDKVADIQQAKVGLCRCQLVGEPVQFGGWKGWGVGVEKQLSQVLRAPAPQTSRQLHAGSGRRLCPLALFFPKQHLHFLRP